MDTRVLKTLEYDKVIRQLEEKASSTLGKAKAASLTPSADIEEVRRRQQMTHEGMEVLRLKGGALLGGIRDIRASLKRASIGGMLGPQELMDIASTLYASGRLKKFIFDLTDEHDLPILQGLAERITPHRPLQQAIKSCIDDNGQVLDAASPALRKIRQQIRTLEARVREKLDQITRSSAKQKMLQESIVTIRNDRYVIPVKQEYRPEFGGIVHDQSTSGATVFVEPQSVVNINNELNEAKIKEEKEIERILSDLTVQVQAVAEEVEVVVELLAEIDFIFAKAYFAESINGVQPNLNDRSYIRIKKGRHPLIPREEVVPIDIEFGNDVTSVIITGPNTGGKTVSLKTVGLLTLMAMSGLPIPAEEGSQIAVFSSVFADIGDEQSIEQSLSTFSGHMKNIIGILRQFDHRSLILLDELGAGTDPTEGAALAISILDYIRQRGARVLATTHYSEMKAYAYNREGVVNASVEFDVKTLRPTYRLLMGIPGKSNAFAIAERLGLEDAIIRTAKEQVGADENQVQRMIDSLEEQRKQKERERSEAEQLRKEAEQLWNELEREKQKLESERERWRREAKAEAEQAVSEAKEEAERIIAELRELAMRERAGIKEHRLIEARKRLEEAVPDWEDSRSGSSESRLQRAEREQKAKPIEPGDEVHVRSVGQKGHVIEKTGKNEYEVQIGIVKMKVKVKDLEPVEAKASKSEQQVTRVQSKRETIRPELDLRGYNVEDALIDIDKYLDEALLSGLNQVTLIHGKGTGVLRKGVQNFLKRHKHVKSFRLGGQGEGGAGSTVVELK